MTAPRRLSHTDQLETLRAEIALFEDRVRNARFTSRTARFLLWLAEGNRRLREALATRLCPLCDGLDFPECAECECPVPCPRCPQGTAGGPR